jgi:AbrB family looped-hinge helix DNA binding protein
MKSIEKEKPLFLDADGLGRITIPKAWVELLGWQKGDKITLTLNPKEENVCINVEKP